MVCIRVRTPAPHVVLQSLHGVIKVSGSTPHTEGEPSAEGVASGQNGDGDGSAEGEAEASTEGEADEATNGEGEAPTNGEEEGSAEGDDDGSASGDTSASGDGDASPPQLL